METQFSIIVIGNGLIVSAAARYLAGESDAVALLGPPEPCDWENHDGVFSSHYDEGRITRIMDSNPHWAEFTHRSIDQYPIIEKESGIRFFHPVGCLQGPQIRMPGNQWNSLQNEAARHKLLDVIGDLALVGVPIRGKVFAHKPGHKVNAAFSRKLSQVAKKIKEIF